MELTLNAAEFTPYHRGRTVRDPLDKEFVAWDGEGITPDGEDKQNYVLFGNSKGFTLKGRKLGTAECLNLIIATELAHPNAIHVGFAFGYDVEMILCDLSIKHLKTLRAKGSVLWREFRIEYKRSKWFQITKTDPFTKDKTSARIWDVWGFFQSSFVKAIGDNLDDVPATELKRIQDGKAGRSHFTYEDLDSGLMVEYWKTELVYLIRMMIALRERLYAAGLQIRQWHGPGAIATYAFRSRKMSKAMSRDIPPEVNLAAQYAYAGGRFELFKVGAHNAPVYAYDIRSAYPSAIKELPNLARGQWVYRDSPRPGTLARFGVYRLRFSNASLMSARPMPYFYRDSHYAIHFPNVCEGWYWTPEANYASFLGNDCTLLEGWEFIEDDSTDRPFAWVEDVYETRAQWKRDGNASQMALKLLLNSLYGKMAQRVGWERSGGPPTWHQLEWAGYVTSLTRSKIFRAMLLAHKTNSLIGVETDGIFSSSPLDLDLGPKLGQWEAEKYDAMIYLQSGFYFKSQNSEWSAKYRGFDKGSVTYDDTLDVLKRWQPWTGDKGILSGTTTRFATMGAYLQSPYAENLRNRWSTLPRELSIGGDGKRIHRHTVCPQCRNEISPADAMHLMSVSHPIGGMSLPHSLPWLHNGSDPNPYRKGDKTNADG